MYLSNSKALTEPRKVAGDIELDECCPPLASSLPHEAGRLTQGTLASIQCNEAVSDIAMDENAIRSALKEVIDPELGINIVDLGLIDRIVKLDDGIEVALVMTTPACPLSEMLVEQAQQTLANHFPRMASIRVELLRDIPWSPDRMTEAGRRQFGLTADSTPDTMT